MTDSARIADWQRFYFAAQPSYKPHALHAVWRNDRALFPAVVKALGLTLAALMEHMEVAHA